MRFKDLVEQIGRERAEEIAQIESKKRKSLTVSDWVNHLHRPPHRRRPEDSPGVTRVLPHHDQACHRRAATGWLSREEVSRWVLQMRAAGAKQTTIANKHALPSAALTSAVTAGHIPANPAAGTKIPRDVRREMVCLGDEQFAALLAAVTEPHRPLVEFLVASGCP
ncbi:hypothetical protein [Mycobacterium hackensackense]|uniref:hypothetical protein n=1 Tax=Mycobacterium hackensackense TaxID=228909 RepID=UPI002265A5A7|nr:hypothetical protein [Mycobacterium hackensackense]